MDTNIQNNYPENKVKRVTNKGAIATPISLEGANALMKNPNACDTIDNKINIKRKMKNLSIFGFNPTNQ